MARRAVRSRSRGRRAKRGADLSIDHHLPEVRRDAEKGTSGEAQGIGESGKVLRLGLERAPCGPGRAVLLFRVFPPIAGDGRGTVPLCVAYEAVSPTKASEMIRYGLSGPDGDLHSRRRGRNAGESAAKRCHLQVSLHFEDVPSGVRRRPDRLGRLVPEAALEWRLLVDGPLHWRRRPPTHRRLQWQSEQAFPPYACLPSSCFAIRLG